MKSERIQPSAEDAANLGNRIRFAAKLVGSGGALSRTTDISRTTIESYFKGNSEPNASRLMSIAKVSGLSISWLVTGEGPTFEDEYNNSPQPSLSKDTIPLDESVLVAVVEAAEEWFSRNYDKHPVDARARANIIRALYRIEMKNALETGTSDLDNVANRVNEAMQYLSEIAS